MVEKVIEVMLVVFIGNLFFGVLGKSFIMKGYVSDFLLGSCSRLEKGV